MPLAPEEEDELKRRQLEALRRGDETREAAGGCLQGCGCLFVGLPLTVLAILFVVWIFAKCSGG